VVFVIKKYTGRFRKTFSVGGGFSTGKTFCVEKSFQEKFHTEAGKGIS